ncbi:MAG: putative DNA binding domain-containing protein [Lentisphaeraceae bacterium]|nr:putative DNA binding domain-containing protein [Lentisphaeraceae bacterium]
MSKKLDKLIEILLREGETEWIEFKENNDNPQVIGEYLSALSNGAALLEKAHAYLIYGIEDSTRKVIGTNFDPSKTKGKGNEDLEPWLARLLDPRIDFKFISHVYEDKPIVIIQINSAHTQPTKFSGKAFIRIGEHRKSLSDYPEKERRLWDCFSRIKFEFNIALENQTSDEILSKIDYPAFFELLALPLPDNRAGILSKLKEERVIYEDEEGLHITNLGGVLFAKKLDDFPSLKRKAPRVIIYKDESRVNAAKEEVGRKGYAVGFEGLINWIDDQLPSNEFIEEALRTKQKMYPKVAIREFVANALIHQDFSITGTGPMIEIFPSRMEITNPGQPLVDTLRFIDHPPRSRNEELASIMRRMNICEERGSGVDRAIINIQLYQLPAPEFQAEDSYTRVTLFSYRELKDMDRKDKVRACYQHCVLTWLQKDFMSNATLRQRLNVKEKNYSMVSRIIKDTLDAGLIKVSDPENKSTKKKYIPVWA